jgi:hypothetical protein
MRSAEREEKKSTVKKETAIRNRLRGIDNECDPPPSNRNAGSGALSWKNDHLGK